MISVPRVVCVLSCGFMLSLEVSPAAEATMTACDLKAGLLALRHGGQEPGTKQMNDMERDQLQSGKTITGEVLRVEDPNYFVQGPEDKEGRLRIDPTTPRARSIKPDNRNEAKANHQNDALSIPLDQGLNKCSRPLF